MRAIDYFDRGHDLKPDRPAIIQDGKTLTFAETAALTRRVAQAMYAGGFRNQEPAALYSPNSWEVMVALLSICAPMANGCRSTPAMPSTPTSPI